MLDEGHHVQLSPISQIPGVKMVSDVVLDPMHLLYLGVMRKLLHFRVKSPLGVRLAVTLSWFYPSVSFLCSFIHHDNLLENRDQFLSWRGGRQQSLNYF